MNPFETFSRIISMLSLEKRLSFEDITEMLSPDVDKIILVKELTGKKFIGGDFHVRAMGNSNFLTSFEMYFKIPYEEDFELVQVEGNVLPMSRLNSEAILKLKSSETKELTFPITAPKTS